MLAPPATSLHVMNGVLRRLLLRDGLTLGGVHPAREGLFSAVRGVGRSDFGVCGRMGVPRLLPLALGQTSPSFDTLRTEPGPLSVDGKGGEGGGDRPAPGPSGDLGTTLMGRCGGEVEWSAGYGPNLSHRCVQVLVPSRLQERGLRGLRLRGVRQDGRGLEWTLRQTDSEHHHTSALLHRHAIGWSVMAGQPFRV